MTNNDDMGKQQHTTQNQYAFIWNYNAYVEHQHNYGGGKPVDDVAEKDADNEKRRLLLATNAVIRTQTPSGRPTVDLLKLYRFVDRHFVSEIAFKYEWYALRRFLEKYRLLRDCDNERFAAQMNDDAWFRHSPKSCEAKEMNSYNYLNNKQPDTWCSTDIQLGSKATKKSVANVYKAYSNLELYKDELLS